MWDSELLLLQINVSTCAVSSCSICCGARSDLSCADVGELRGAIVCRTHHGRLELHSRQVCKGAQEEPQCILLQARGTS